MITFSAVWIPWVCTAIGLVMMFRPYRSRGDYDFGEVFRLFWSVPILAAWVVYLLLTRQ